MSGLIERTNAQRASEERLKRCHVPIRRIDEYRQIVYGLVYAADHLDTYGEFMCAEDVEDMCHRFAQLTPDQCIDTNHDNISNGSFPVESYIVRSPDPDFPVGGWVMGVKVPDFHVWRQILAGELNSFSFEALVRPVRCMVTIDSVRDVVGATEPQHDHEHLFFIITDLRGVVRQGWTDRVKEHWHRIVTGSRTEMAGALRHNHRYFLTA